MKNTLSTEQIWESHTKIWKKCLVMVLLFAIILENVGKNIPRFCFLYVRELFLTQKNPESPKKKVVQCYARSMI